MTPKLPIKLGSDGPAFTALSAYCTALAYSPTVAYVREMSRSAVGSAKDREAADRPQLFARFIR